MPENNLQPQSGAAEFTFRRIGTIRTAAQHRFEAPRQAVFAHEGAFLCWDDPVLFAPAAEDLIGFERIWLIWVFDRNEAGHWRPKVRVPVPAERDKYSVFATRSPYRPNPIGISVVELKGIAADGLELGVCDLLDGTAVLDVKPYIPEADAFPASKAGWRDRVEKRRWTVVWSAEALAKAQFLAELGGVDLVNFAAVQLAFAPLDKTRKRLTQVSTTRWRIGCRTWQLEFDADEAARRIEVREVLSHYTQPELTPGAPDPYGDKAFHRALEDKFHVTQERS